MGKESRLGRCNPFGGRAGFAVMRLASANEAIERGSVKGFDFQEFVGDFVELIAVIAKDLPGFAVGRVENFFDLSIDLLGGRPRLIFRRPGTRGMVRIGW